MSYIKLWLPLQLKCIYESSTYVVINYMISGYFLSIGVSVSLILLSRHRDGSQHTRTSFRVRQSKSFCSFHAQIYKIYTVIHKYMYDIFMKHLQNFTVSESPSQHVRTKGCCQPSKSEKAQGKRRNKSDRSRFSLLCLL